MSNVLRFLDFDGLILWINNYGHDTTLPEVQPDVLSGVQSNKNKERDETRDTDIYVRSPLNLLARARSLG